MLKEHDYVLLSVLMLDKAKEHNAAVKREDYEKATLLIAEFYFTILALRIDGITSFTLNDIKVKVE